jgi:hypothetical protein
MRGTRGIEAGLSAQQAELCEQWAGNACLVATELITVAGVCSLSVSRLKLVASCATH